MAEIQEINVTILDELIIGRVEPHIYAFTTETIPNYLKVGDTYRPIETRLNEWRKHFPNLEKKFENVAKVDDETFFRDYAVHYFLENELKRNRLERNSIVNIPYFSNEFFKNATKQDLQDAINDIKLGHQNNDSKYQYYRFDESPIPITHTYSRTENYAPRPNQEATIQKFREAIGKGRVNLLMYAVMRFGKSFTAMCCAIEMNAKLVVVVSAKADVKQEWKKTVESHIKFDGYSFLDSDSLLQSDTILADKQKTNQKIVLFLTLQDLQGDAIKAKHKALFENQIDLLLIDETHFGARAIEYGKVLKNQNLNAKELKNELKFNDSSLDDVEITKVFNTKIRIHLSGTPYRILMNSEFTDDDLIAFYQFSDIAADQEKWNAENLNKDDIKEWDNPYYGFPQMIRFAFEPNESSRKKMEELKQKGITYAFSALFKPKSITLDNNKLHKKFEHEQEIIDLLKVIDGSEKDANILSFLDYSKIKEGKMCRHIVCVLPYRASCDAFEELIKNQDFKHLSDYEIINISGIENEKAYKDTQAVQSKIKKCESENIKTITLTVNRMLTGSTVPEWDTMLYFKDTTSPQEYDQAVFRLQNQYIKVFKEPNGDVLKYNMKPQTLLVDFNPNRMFLMQEHKSQIYNVNTDANGNNKLEDRIKKELKIAPIIVLNKNRMVQIEATDILDAVSEYANNRSVLDEATSIGIDYSLLDIEEIKAEIEKQNKIGSHNGFELKPTKGKGDDIKVPTHPKTEEEPTNATKPKDNETEAIADYKGQFAMFYARILFFAFLTDSRVKSLQEVIGQMTSNADNLRIAANLNLKDTILLLFQKHINPFILSELDYKIQNINSLANDTAILPEDRASNAMKKFSRLSESEIVTPETVTDKMIDALPADAINESTMLLDIAAKQGEFVYAVFKKYGKAVANRFYSIPTSKIAYEFTRKVYNLLELDMELIEENYTSYDLIKEHYMIEEEAIKINHQKIKFDIIVGNPPYQMKKEGDANKNFASPIYNEFIDVAKKLNPNYISIIMPTRWYAGGSDLDEFRDQMLNDIHISELHDFLKPELIFQDINLRGGICYFLWEKNYNNTKYQTKVFTYNDDLNPKIHRRSLKTEGTDILIRHNLAIEMLKKIKSHSEFLSFEPHISSLRPFGFRGYFAKDEKFRDSPKGLKNAVICYGKGKKIGYIERVENTKNTDWIDKFKVFTPRANNIGTELNDDNLNTFIGNPNTICTESYIVVGVDLELNKLSATNLCKYFTTKFTRFQHSVGKASQDATSKTYKFIPLQNFTPESDIDWSKSVEEIDQQLYAKYLLSQEEIEFIETMIKPMN